MMSRLKLNHTQKLMDDLETERETCKAFAERNLQLEEENKLLSLTISELQKALEEATEENARLNERVCFDGVVKSDE